MRLVLCICIAGAVALAVLGCGDSEDGTRSAGPGPQVKREMARQHAAARHHARVIARRVARRHHARVLARRHHRAEIRQLRVEEVEQAAAEEAEAVEEEANECNPNYSGACLNPYASDYDCSGGSGDGPEYTGTVTVVGEDQYGLDADGDGTGCELE